MADEITVLHLPDERRFVVRLEGREAELAYRRRDATTIDFLHTGVPPELGGRGIAGKLAEAGLGFARSEGLKVRPYCPFVRGYIGKHPAFADLVVVDFQPPEPD